MSRVMDLSSEFEDWPPVPELQIKELPSASDVYIQYMTSQVDQEKVQQMTEAQKHMLSRFEKTNEMLLNFNALSTARYNTACQDFVKHTQLLTDMKQDLDSIFKRIRILKSKLSKQHPQAFKACVQVLDEEEEEEEEEQQQELPSCQVTINAPEPVESNITEDTHNTAGPSKDQTLSVDTS